MLAPNEVSLTTHIDWLLVGTAIPALCAVAFLAISVPLSKSRFPSLATQIAAVLSIVGIIALIAGGSVRDGDQSTGVGLIRYVPGSSINHTLHDDFGLRRADGNKGTFFDAHGNLVSCDTHFREISGHRAALSVSCGSVVMPKHGSH